MGQAIIFIKNGTMADEKVIIIEVDIESKAATKAIEALKIKAIEQKKALDEMTEGLDKNEKATKQATQEYIKANAEYKVTQSEIRTNEKLLQSLTIEQNNNIESIESLRNANKILSTERNKLDLTTEQGQKRLLELNKQLDSNNAKIKENVDASTKQKLTIGGYKDEVKKAIDELGGMPPAFSAAGDAGKKLNTIFSLITKNPLIATLGLIVGALTALFKAFSRTQDGADKLTKLMAGLEAIFDTIVGLTAEFATSIVDAVTNPKQAIKDLGETIEEYLTGKLNAVKSIAEGVTGFFSNVFKGEFSKAFESAGDAASTFVDEFTPIGTIKDVVEGVSDAVDGLTESLEAAAKEAIAVENIRIRLRKETIKATEADANSRKEFEKYKFLAEDVNTEIEKRIEFAEKAGDIEIARAEDLVKLEKLKLQLLQSELSATPQNLRNDEQLLAIAEQRAKIAEVEAQSFTKRNEIRNKANSLRLEQEKEIEAQRVEAAKKVEEAELEAAKKAQEKLDKEVEAEIEAGNKKIEAAKIDFENRKALAENNAFELLEIEREALQQKKEDEIKVAEETGANIALINDKYREADLALDKAKVNAQLSLASDFAGQIAGLAGEATAIGKTAAIAQTAINTYLGAQSAFAQTPGGIVIKSFAAAAAVATGLANVKKILSIKSGLPKSGGGGGGGGASISGGGSTPSIPTTITPDIGAGIVSRDISTQVNQPDDIKLQPTLVTNDVTNAQNQKTNENNTATL